MNVKELKKNVEENGISYHFNPGSRCPDFVEVFLLKMSSQPYCFLNKLNPVLRTTWQD